MPSLKFISNIKEILLSEKKDRLGRFTQDSDIDSDGDEIDEIQANIQIDLFNRFNILNKGQLKLIDSALERIENQTYGICADCEEPIPEKRLLANPHYTTCVGCAEDREMEEKQRKGF